MAEDKPQEKQQDDDLKLPNLSPFIKLYKGMPEQDGAPSWVLYHPASNKHYKIGWAEFECLARFHQCETASALIKRVNEETTLEVSMDDIRALLIFLSQHGLLNPGQQIPNPKTPEAPLWKQALKGYLFITLPLFKPQKMLDAAYPFVKPLLSRTFFYISLAVLFIASLLTLRQSDTFFHTFTQIFTLEGIMMTAIVFTAIKMLHELGHAFMAKHYGVPVPHMGVALMVLYPVFYTEMTGTWRISSRKARIYMGLAGVMTEIVLASFFLLYWHLTPSAMGQSIAFSVVMISLLGSFLINLNPFMRFDGYYVLSDTLGIENLHSKAIAFAKRWIRNTFFGLREDIPDPAYQHKERFLTWFGLGVITYRFFLYMGIATLVYFVAFKPLGLILMLVEIGWFIALPVFKEVQYLITKKDDIISSKRAKISFGVCAALFLFLLIPSQTTIHTVAIEHPAQYQRVYPPAPAYIEEILVKDGQIVQKDTILAKLSSPALEEEYAQAKAHLNNLQTLKRRSQTNIESYKERRALIDEEIRQAQQKLKAVKTKKDKLNVTADFKGKIYDINPEIHAGRYIQENDLILRLISKDTAPQYTAYIRESDLERVVEGDKAQFTPSYALLSTQDLILTRLEQTNIETIEWPELASIYGGEIAAKRENNNEIKPLDVVYRAVFNGTEDTGEKPEIDDEITKGHIKIYGDRMSPVFRAFKQFYALVMREIGLN